MYYCKQHYTPHILIIVCKLYSETIAKSNCKFCHVHPSVRPSARYVICVCVCVCVCNADRLFCESPTEAEETVEDLGVTIQYDLLYVCC